MHPYTDPVTGIPVDSAQFRQRASRVVLTGDPDTDTGITAQEMCREIRQAAHDPLVRAIALNAARRIRGGPVWLGSGADPMSPRVLADSMFWWAKHYLEFRHHGDMFEAWSGQLGDPANKLQLLIAPDVLVRMRRMEGDCAIYTMMVCALLESLGVQWQVCPCAVDHSQPRIFSHVFARAAFPDGSTESLDASHGPYPGWQVPKRDLLRLWVFDRNGSRIASQDGPGFSGLHDYRRTRRGMRGMGVMVCDDSGCYDDGTGTGTFGGNDPLNPAPYYNPTQVFGPNVASDPAWSGFPSTTVGSTQGVVAPSQNSAQWAIFASNLAKAGLTLAEINSIQPGTVVSPNGAILRQTPGYAVPVGSALTTSLSSSSGILYMGLGLVGLLVVGSMFKGGR